MLNNVNALFIYFAVFRLEISNQLEPPVDIYRTRNRIPSCKNSSVILTIILQTPQVEIKSTSVSKYRDGKALFVVSKIF